MAEEGNAIPQIVAAIKQCQGKVTLAAQRLGIAPNEIRALADAHPEIKAAIEEALSRFQETAELAFERAVINGETWAVREAIKRMGRSRSSRVSATQSKPIPKNDSTEEQSQPPVFSGLRMKLTQKQRNALVAWAAEGLRLAEINERAAQFDPPFKVEWHQLKHVRKQAEKRFTELREEFEKEALAEGLARKALRIRRLVQLAEKIEEDFYENNRLWVIEPKQVGAEVVDVERFNAAEVKEYRGLLDDIARELGDRRTKIDLRTVDVNKLSDEELDAIIGAEGESGA
jgi:hypothetical protein